MDKLLSPFEAPDSGEGTSPLERAGNYVFDLITVTVGAAVTEACLVMLAFRMLAQRPHAP